MTTTDVMRLLRSPLVTNKKEQDFFAAVLAECALYGVPPDAIGLFKDLHAMLGFSEPVGEKQISALAAPLVAWRSYPNQPEFDRIIEVERLAYQQRALIAFGGGRPGEMVGRAEIVHALGNLLEEDPVGDGNVPETHIEVWRWACIDTLMIIQSKSKEEILADAGKGDWADIPDDEIIKPGGRLYPTYQEICTHIRRDSIRVLEKNPLRHPRSFLRPWAVKFIEDLQKFQEDMRKKIDDPAAVELVKNADRRIAAIRRMFPDLKTYDEELEHRAQVVERALDIDLGV
jgi:hypothetical protein